MREKEEKTNWLPALIILLLGIVLCIIIGYSKDKPGDALASIIGILVSSWPLAAIIIFFLLKDRILKILDWIIANPRELLELLRGKYSKHSDTSPEEIP